MSRRSRKTKLLGSLLHMMSKKRSIFWPPTEGFILDRFITDRAAGLVNNTSAEPGPGTRMIVDTDSKISIASGQLRIDTTHKQSLSDPSIYYQQPIERVAGKMLFFRMTVGSGVANVNISLCSDTTTVWYDIGGLVLNNYTPSSSLYFGSGASPIVVDWNLDPGVEHIFCMVLGNIGGYLFRLIDSKWEFVMHTIFCGCSSPLYVVVNVYDSDNTTYFDDIQIAQTLWLPTPCAYDSFQRSDGNLGSTENNGPDDQPITPLSWNVQAGSVQISSNAAKATSLSGGKAIATVNVNNSNVIVVSRIKTSVGGIIVRYSDINNYWYAKWDGDYIKLIKRVGGVESTVINLDWPWPPDDDYEIGIVADGEHWVLYYGGNWIDEAWDSDLINNTKVGMYFINTSSSLYCFEAWPKGKEDQYDELFTIWPES